MRTTIVWFKRDLRVQDHAPLALAAGRGRVLPLYVVEPEQWQQGDASRRHYQAVGAAVEELRAALAALGQPLLLRCGAAEDWLPALARQCGADRVHSHEETGNDWSFQRDRRVARALAGAGIEWRQFRQFGVVRGLRQRHGWSAQWESLMAAPQATAPTALSPLPALPAGTWPTAEELGLRDPAVLTAQHHGRSAGLQRLHSFLDHRGLPYRRAMSAPASAARHCSRLSVALATGCLSLREVVQATRQARATLDDRASGDRAGWAAALRAFESRLHWHCHFIQKLESEPAIEFHNVNRAFDGLREADFDAQRFRAWCSGHTGWPLVDACMRSLLATGWLNFRMRAMLVSVAAWLLWLHWREPALHLARCFTDYEPGIHYAQCQMQSGVTGINVPRIYNPIKQSREQDPAGRFIRRWLPELAGVPDSLLHTPWLMDARQQQASACRLDRDYPRPLVDHEQAAREARARLSAHHAAHPELRERSREVLLRHGSRQRQSRPRWRAPDATRQGDLFGG